MKLSIIIPCFNEINFIEKILNKIKISNKFESEIIIIDDFSKDGTREFLENIKNDKDYKIFYNDKNYGKGFSVRKGIENSSGEIILIQDADLEYDPSDYSKLVTPIINDEADVVYGSRFVGSDLVRVHMFWHKVGNNFLTLLSNIFTNLNLTDMENCYKAFKADVLKKIVLKENRFGFEPEVTAKISKLKNLRIYEVPVKYKGRSYSEGKKISWKDGFSALRCIFYYNIFK